MRKLIILATLFAASLVRAAVPSAFSVEGVLRDSTGKLQSMMVAVTVTLYDAQTQGNKLAGPYGPTMVMAQNGLFNLPIQDTNLQSELANASQLWLEVTVGSDTFARQPVNSQLFALRCGVAEGMPNVSDVSDRIGIGTTTPLANLHIRPSSGTAAADAHIQVDMTGSGDGSPNSILVGADGTRFHGAAYIDTSAVGVAAKTPLTFRISGTEYMRLDTPGNVGIGTTTPQYTLDVNGSIRGANLAPSDARLKTNVRTIEHALDDVERLRGVRFDWKKDGTHSIGVIAQELEKVYPELVSTADYKAVEYAKLTAVLIEAVKDLRHQNAALEARLSRLEASRASHASR